MLWRRWGFASQTSRLGRLALSFALAVVLLLGMQWLLRAQETTPVPALIRGHVTLERPNSPPPSEPWRVPLVLTFTLSSDPPPGALQVVTQAIAFAMTDDSGYFVVTPVLSINLTYDIYVKNFHTLRNVKRGVLITPPVEVDLGLLLEGDANNDNRIRISDFAILRNAYFTDEGEPGFDPRADFDEDGKIRIRDFALLRGNYFASGDIEVASSGMARALPARPAAGVDFEVIPARQQVAVGDPVTVTLVADAGEQAIVGADVRLTYDPRLLAGIRSIPSTAFDLVLINSFGGGELRFSAATFGAPVDGRIELTTLVFRALRETPGAELHLAEVDATDADGRSVVGGARDGWVKIGSGFPRWFLPLVLRMRP